MVVCPFCRSAVARTDRGLDDLGKVAEIVQTASPLRVGLRGTWQGKRFELTGRAQLRHQAGGFWDEWYATFSNGWVGWLAEAQGRFYLTFFRPLPEGTALPGFEDLKVGAEVDGIPGPKMVVAEKGVATAASAEGQIPYQLIPNEQSNYADLSGHDLAFGTIDYGNVPPWLFLGKQVTLLDLGLQDARPAERPERRVTTAAMGCPNCGGPLALEAPDRTERVTCPNCNSLLDVNAGRLSYLKSLLPPPTRVSFVLPLGAEGTFDGHKYKVIGAMMRSVNIEGITYYWHEYLLYERTEGFRWLVHSDGHWNFVEAVNLGDVQTGMFNTARFGGDRYKRFQDAPARVEYVTGEFYWRVEQGETVKAVDYVAAPYMLSEEATDKEVNWSRGKYVPVSDIEKAFGIKDLPRPTTVGPNQPFTGRFWYTWGLLPLALLLAASVLTTLFTGFGRTVYDKAIELPPMTGPETAQVAFSEPFQIQAGRNVQITASAPVDNSFVELDVDLINEASQEVEAVTIPIEYYYGTDSDGSWTEGSRSQDATVSALPAGQYTLRVEGAWQNFQQPMPISIRVEQNVIRGVNFILAFLLLAIAPVVGIFRKILFESARWQESMFGGGD